MEQHVAVYVRVSTAGQSTRSQEPDIKRWLAAYAAELPVKWYRDTASGKDMSRPGWQQLEAAVQAGAVSRIVVWRIDRLGRTAAGLTALFEDLNHRGIGLVSLRDNLDLQTPSGRLMAGVLASVASYEREIRGERQAAGIAAAKAAGKTWGGRRPGARYKATPALIRQARRMLAEGETKSEVARLLGVSRPTLYSILQD